MARHFDDLYSLNIYQGRHDGNVRVFTDLIISKRYNYVEEIYLASISGQNSHVEKMIDAARDGSKSGRFSNDAGYDADKDIIQRVLMHTGRNKYDHYTSKVEDVTHALLVSKTILPKTNERLEWEREQKEKQIYEPLPSTLYELVVSWDGDIEEEIFKVLNERYSVPMIDEWKDYVVEKLLRDDYFEHLNVFTFGIENPVEAGLLKLTEGQLERIISEGVRNYELDFAVMEDPTQEDVLTSCESLDDYLTHFSGDLAECIQENIDLRFDPKVNKHSEAFRDVNLQANKNGITGLFPPQADTVMGVAEVLKEDNYAFVIGEMG